MPRFPITLVSLVFLAVVAGCHWGLGNKGSHHADSGKVSPRLPNREAIAKQLPPDVQLDTVAECELGGANKITVEEQLVRVQAQVGEDGKLHDGTGKPIEFFRLTGCWGNPPGDYQQILDDQNRRLNKLRTTHTVITITCNPTGQLIP
jgi:hypothetical protein